MRYHIHNKDHTKFVEFIHDEQGLEEAKTLRRVNQNYKHQRIQDCLQMFPHEIIAGVEYSYS